MKKQWLILLLLLIIPLAKAEITLEGPSKDSYNLGDKLDIKTDIIEPESIHGLLKIELNCETTSPLLIKTISLEPNERYSLKETLPIPPFLSGTCTITSSILIGENIIDQAQSKSFTISNTLLGNLEIDKTETQLGEKINLKGTITKQDSTPLKGIVNIFFKSNENLVSMETLEITDGSVGYEFDTISKPAGTYVIEIDASDIYGNKYISNELTFNLIDQLILDIQLDKTETLPDSKVELTGAVKDVNNNPTKEGKVTISIGDQIYITEISKGSFTQKIEIPETIKSGQHIIHVIVEDNFGNIAEKDIPLSITPVPTALEIKTSLDQLKPESIFKVTAFVYDQAADPINEKTKIEIKNAKKETVLEKEVSAEEEVNVEIPQSASPGFWTITGFASNLKTEKEITIEEVSSIDVEIEGQSLKVKNTGNINYKESVPVTFINEEEETTKEIKSSFFGIKPTAFATYDLGKYVKTGNYDILVNNKEFNDISISQTKSFFSIFYLIPVAIIIVLLIFIFLAKNLKSKPKKTKEQKDFEKGKEKGDEIRSKKPPMSDQQLKEHYRKDFMKSMLKQVEKRDQKVQKRLKFDFSSKKEPPKSFASMKIDRKPTTIISTLQKRPETPFEKKPLWRILRRKGLDRKSEPIKKPEEPKKPGLFSMFD